MKKALAFLLSATAVLSVSCGNSPQDPQPSDFDLTSTAFVDSGSIPIDYTMQGANLSPELAWTDAPASTAGLALICTDVTVPGGFIHWVVYDIPADLVDLPEGIPTVPNPDGTFRQGMNDFGFIGYGGPFPPSGETHTYEFELFALDTSDLGLRDSLTAGELDQAMEGHVLEAVTLMGTYTNMCGRGNMGT